MSYTLAAAAKATGLNKSTILRAIKDGEIAGTKDRRGEWHIEPAELHRIYPPVAWRSAGGDAARRYPAPDVEALGAEIEALLRRAGDCLRRQLADVRSDDATDPDQAQASHRPRHGRAIEKSDA
jgi:excisionase family DNA binding protein